jgi:hypothetical protein
MKWTELVARMGEKISTYRLSAGKLEGKRTFGRPGCRQDGNIKVYLKNNIGWRMVHLAQARTCGGLL